MYVAQNRNQIGIRCPNCGSLQIQLLDYEKYLCKNPHSDLKPQNFTIGISNRPKTKERLPLTAGSGSASLIIKLGPSPKAYSSIGTNEIKAATEPFTKTKDLDDCKISLLKEIKKIHDAYQHIQSVLDEIPTHMTSTNIEIQVMDDSIWNLPGLFFFNRGNFSLSEMVYSSS